MSWVRRVAAAICMATPVVIVLGVPEQLRFVPGFEWTWELPGPLPAVVILTCPAAFFLLLPDLVRRSQALSVGLVTLAILLLGFGSLVCAVWTEGSRQVLRLEAPGDQAAAITLTYDVISELELWTREPTTGRWRMSWRTDSSLDLWTRPLTARKADDEVRYLVVDADGMPVVLLDLPGDAPGPEGGWRVSWQFPSIEELRAEFGGDLVEPDY